MKERRHLVGVDKLSSRQMCLEGSKRSTRTMRKHFLQFLYEVVVRVSDASDRADDEADYRTSARDERRWRDGYSRARWLSQKWRKRYASQKVAEDEKRDGVCAEPD